jgi:hypothetical protein
MVNIKIIRSMKFDSGDSESGHDNDMMTVNSMRGRGGYRPRFFQSIDRHIVEPRYNGHE